MRWLKHAFLLTFPLILFLSILILSINSSPNSQTHRLVAGTYWFKFDQDGSRITFSQDISFGDSNGMWRWIDNDTIRLRNLKVGDITQDLWKVTVRGPANLTVTKFFVGNLFEASVSAQAGTQSIIKFDTYSYGVPEEVYINDVAYGSYVPASDFDSMGGTFWSYDGSTNMLYVKILHSSDATLKVDWNPTGGDGINPIPPLFVTFKAHVLPAQFEQGIIYNFNVSFTFVGPASVTVTKAEFEGDNPDWFSLNETLPLMFWRTGLEGYGTAVIPIKAIVPSNASWGSYNLFLKLTLTSQSSSNPYIAQTQISYTIGESAIAPTPTPDLTPLLVILAIIAIGVIISKARH